MTNPCSCGDDDCWFEQAAEARDRIRQGVRRVADESMVQLRIMKDERPIRDVHLPEENL